MAFPSPTTSATCACAGRSPCWPSSGIALVVAVLAVLMAMSEGFASALRSTGRTDNAMIVQRGSASELTLQRAARARAT